MATAGLAPETGADVVFAIAAVEAGESITSVAGRLGRSASGLYRLIAAYGPCVARRRRRGIGQAEREKIAELVREDVLGVREIARVLKRSPSSVIELIRQAREAEPASRHPRQVASYWCGGCGNKVSLVPCVICSCKGAKRAA